VNFIRESQIEWNSIYKEPVDVLSTLLFDGDFIDGVPHVNYNFRKQVPLKYIYSANNNYDDLIEFYYDQCIEEKIQELSKIKRDIYSVFWKCLKKGGFSEEEIYRQSRLEIDTNIKQIVRLSGDEAPELFDPEYYYNRFINGYRAESLFIFYPFIFKNLKLTSNSDKEFKLIARCYLEGSLNACAYYKKNPPKFKVEEGGIEKAILYIKEVLIYLDSIDR